MICTASVLCSLSCRIKSQVREAGEQILNAGNVKITSENLIFNHFNIVLHSRAMLIRSLFTQCRRNLRAIGSFRQTFCTAPASLVQRHSSLHEFSDDELMLKDAGNVFKFY